MYIAPLARAFCTPLIGLGWCLFSWQVDQRNLYKVFKLDCCDYSSNCLGLDNYGIAWLGKHKRIATIPLANVNDVALILAAQPLRAKTELMLFTITSSRWKWQTKEHLECAHYHFSFVAEVLYSKTLLIIAQCHDVPCSNVIADLMFW